MSGPDVERELEAVFIQFGAASFLAQHLETTLTIILIANARAIGIASSLSEISALDSALEKPLGSLIRKLRTNVSIPEGADSVLKEALDKRNFLIHRFFRERVMNLDTPAGRQRSVVELREIQAKIHAANELAKEIRDSFLMHLDITPESLESELQEMRREAAQR